MTTTDSNATKPNSFNKYRKTQIQWEHIPRAKEPDKNLSEKAIKIISVTIPKIKAQGYAIYTHAYLSKITKCKQDQNTNLLKQIYHVFNVNAHKSIVIDGKRYRNVYIIKTHENTFRILDNPKVFFSEESNKISCNQNSCEDVGKDVEEKEKIDSEAEKIRSSTIIYNTNSFNNRSTSNYKKDDSSKKVLKLSDFIDPTEKDCDTLRRLSGRSFSSNAIKEIIKDMARRISDVYFKYKSGFIAYMVQVLKNEMRDEVKISNTNFRIKANMTAEDWKANEIENYLTKIENNLDISPEWRLKKKLVSVLTPITAYNLLINYQGITMVETTTEFRMGVVCVGNIAKFKLREYVELKDFEKEMISKHIKEIHETTNEDDHRLWIEDIEFIMPPKRETETKIGNKDKKSEVAPRIGVWGKLRTEIVSLLGNAGENLDKSLFSKLDAEIDENNKQIKLKAESSFYKKFIEERYSQLINMVATNNGYSIYDITY